MMKFGLKVTAFLALLCGITALNAGIPLVDDEKLIKLITKENNLVVFFSKNNCPDCLKLEAIVESIHTELQESLGAVVVKAQQSNLVGKYDPSKEPSLIYFRRGIPLLNYDRESGDEILQLFAENKVPAVKELSDGNFEHLTQAASGATTGDWFLLFYSDDCVLCQRIYAVWETVGAVLYRRLNVARINRSGAGVETAKRFGIEKSPEFLFLRHGNVYPYVGKDYTPKGLIEFAESGFSKQSNPRTVPPVQSPQNDMSQQLLELITQNWLLIVVILVPSVVIVNLLQFFLRKQSAQKRK